MKRNQLFNARNLTMMAALIAMQIILARFLSIQVSDILRISFESVPVVLAGMWLGPLGGATVALVADILGTIIHGYGAWFAPIALGPIFVGVFSGLATKYFFKSDLTETKDAPKVFLIVLIAGIVNNILIGTVTTSLYSIIMMGNKEAFNVLVWTNFLGRLTTKPFTIVVNAVLVAVVNRAVYRPVIRRIVSRI